MTIEVNGMHKYLGAAGAVFSSLRLKDVLDTLVIEYEHLTGAGKVAVYLADNENKCFKLMAAKGYSELSVKEMKTVPFSTHGIFAEMLSKRQPILCSLGDHSAGFNRAIFEREQSAAQIAIPLIAMGLLVGAILIDTGDLTLREEERIVLWQEFAAIAALGVANAILFGRSEYERARLNALYKTLTAFNENVLNLPKVLQKTADAALVLGNTPYCAVLLCEPDSGQFTLGAFKGLDGGTLSEFNLSSENTLAGKALRDGKTQQLDRNGQDVSGMPRAMGGSMFRSVIVFPLVYRESKMGALMVFSTDEAAFRLEQISLLETLASQASNALYIAQEHESTVLKIMHDPHTGLLNRLYFQAALQTEIERSKRHKHQLGLLLADLDFLSRVNDLFGEDKGDRAIAEIAQTVKATLRKIDLIYRFGGEQFAIILPETPRQGVLEAAERLRRSVQGKEIPGVGTMTISIGASAYPDQGVDAAELITLSEQALDVAKYQDKNKVVEAFLQSTQVMDPLAWSELAKRAKLSVASERQERAKTYLTGAIDYAKWLIKAKTNKKHPSKDHVQLP